MNLPRSRFALWAFLFLALAAPRLAEDVYTEDITDEEEYEKLIVCDNTDILVTSLTILCDSRGSYYYGGPNYRNRETCQAGDKARLQMTFEIIGNLSDVPVYLTITESGGVEYRELLYHEPLCQADGLKHSRRTTCPEAGNYSLSLQFNYTADRDVDNKDAGNAGSSTDGEVFYPYASVGFATGDYKDLYDLGGANTTFCPDNMIVTWTKKHSGGFLSLVWSLLIFIGVICTFAFLIHLIWRREPCCPGGKPCWELQAPLLDDDDDFEDDFDKKSQLIGGRKGILEWT